MSSVLLPYLFSAPYASPDTNAPHKHAGAVPPSSKRPRPAASLPELIRRPQRTVVDLIDDVRSNLWWNDVACDPRESRKQVLYLNLRNATTVDEWRAAAVELDDLEGNDAWKLEDESHEYDHTLVAARLKQLEDARISCDPKKMLFVIRTSLTRHLGGMGGTQLYTHSHIGTKNLIEQYIGSALDNLSSLLDMTNRPGGGGLETRHLLEQVLAARQAFGRSALLLSGGGTFGMNHNGVVKALWESKLLPRIISGSSAGSIVCAVLCTHTDEVLPKVVEEFCYGDLEVFTARGSEHSALQHLVRFLKHGSLYDINNLTRVTKGLVGDLTFQEAYNRTRRILNICVSSASLFELPRLLNYVTAPNVIIWSAVAASCSVPLVFSPATLIAKDPKTGEHVPWNPSEQHWIDGSVDSDLPMTQLAELFNVNHFIVSQVNPHVTPFLKKDNDIMPSSLGTTATTPSFSSVALQSLANLAKDEAIHRLQVMSELGVFPNLLTKLKSVLGQRYSGDITIFPEVPSHQIFKILQNPTTDFILQATLSGERATWPKLSRIQNHCAIELALDDAVQQLRARIAFSPSQVDLRLGVVGRSHSRAGSETTRSRRAKSFRTRRQFQDRLELTDGPRAALPQPVSTASARQQNPVSFGLTHTISGPAKESQDVGKYLSSSQRSESSSEMAESDSKSMAESSSSDDDRAREDKSPRLFPYATQPNTPFPKERRNSGYFISTTAGAATAFTNLTSYGATFLKSSSPVEQSKHSRTGTGPSLATSSTNKD